MEAIEYILNFDVKWDRKSKIETITHWAEYMHETQRKILFAPNFTVWDKYTREFEDVAMAAIKESEKILDAYSATKKRFNSEIVKGIYVRVRVLQEWIKEYLEPIRARDDYKRWKEENGAAFPTSQREFLVEMFSMSMNTNSYLVRRRKDRKTELASSIVELHQLSDSITPKIVENSSRLQKFSHDLQVGQFQY
jgi:hypothetical protein